MSPTCTDPSLRHRVRRGRRADGVLVRAADAVDGAHACPVCGDALTVRRSKLGNRFFAHRGGDGWCGDDDIRHGAAVAAMAVLLDHVRSGLLVLTMDRPCDAGGHRHQHPVLLDAADEIRIEAHDAERGFRYDVAVVRDGRIAMAFEIRKTHAVDVAKAAACVRPWFEVAAQEVLGWAADEAAERCAAGTSSELTMTCCDAATGCPCARCDQTRERQAASEAWKRAQNERFVGILRIAHGFETGLCGKDPSHRRVVLIDGLHDAIEANAVDDDGQKWDLVLRRGGRIVLGILLVGPKAMLRDGDVEHRAAAPGKLPFVAIQRIQPSFHYGPLATNAWHLRNPGRCPVCEILPAFRHAVDQAVAAICADVDAGAIVERDRMFAALDGRIGTVPALGGADPSPGGMVEAARRRCVRHLAEKRVGPALAKQAHDRWTSMLESYRRKYFWRGGPVLSPQEIQKQVRWLAGNMSLSKGQKAIIWTMVDEAVNGLTEEAKRVWPERYGWGP